jgi:hypothetical protein
MIAISLTTTTGEDVIVPSSPQLEPATEPPYKIRVDSATSCEMAFAR